MRTTLMAITMILILANGGANPDKAGSVLAVYVAGLIWSMYWDIHDSKK